MKTIDLFTEIKNITENNIDIIQNRIENLSENQRKWKKDKLSWNINEIFAHLYYFSEYYQKSFKKKIIRTRFREPQEVFISSKLGKAAWKSMKLGNLKNVKRKLKAHRSLNPTIHAELMHQNDVELFKSMQLEFLEIIENAKQINIKKAKIPMAISKIIRLRFGDALLYLNYHNERHIQQAINLIEHPKFPSK